jgi:FtsZ-binding cell division protein ZapB
MDTVSLLMQIEHLKKENEILLNMVSITAQQREKYAAIEKENKLLKENHRVTFAGLAMQALLSNNKAKTYDGAADEAFLMADSMIKKLGINI